MRRVPRSPNYQARADRARADQALRRRRLPAKWLAAALHHRGGGAARAGHDLRHGRPVQRRDGDHDHHGSHERGGGPAQGRHPGVAPGERLHHQPEPGPGRPPVVAPLGGRQRVHRHRHHVGAVQHDRGQDLAGGRLLGAAPGRPDRGQPGVRPQAGLVLVGLRCAPGLPGPVRGVRDRDRFFGTSCVHFSGPDQQSRQVPENSYGSPASWAGAPGGRRPDRTSAARWQAACRPGATACSGGTVVRQTSMASGQRGWNGQPGGVDPARGVSPGRMIRDRRAAASTSGTAERSASGTGARAGPAARRWARTPRPGPGRARPSARIALGSSRGCGRSGGRRVSAPRGAARSAQASGPAL